MIHELGLEPKEIPSPMDDSFDGGDFYYGYEDIKIYFISNSSNEDYYLNLRCTMELVMDIPVKYGYL